MHADIRPFAPFSQANGLYGGMSIETLQVLCVACAIGVVVFLVARHLKPITQAKRIAKHSRRLPGEGLS